MFCKEFTTCFARSVILLRLARSRGKSRKVMIEYCQPNTHKDFHVGHVRNAALGDALVQMFRYQGDEVIAATFPGDEERISQNACGTCGAKN